MLIKNQILRSTNHILGKTPEKLIFNTRLGYFLSSGDVGKYWPRDALKPYGPPPAVPGSVSEGQTPRSHPRPTDLESEF